MDLLPQEIWMHICELACTDGGYTGRSLALVSRQMAGVSEVSKLRSIAISDGVKLTKLVRYLESLPKTRRRVEFLYICTPSIEDTLGDLQDLYKPGMYHQSYEPTSEQILEDGEQLAIHAVTRVLGCVSSSLKILHVCLGWIFREFIFFPVQMDSLEEMILEGPFNEAFRPPFALPSFPHLRHLKITFVDVSTSEHHFSNLVSSISQVASNLTHLYLETMRFPYGSRAILQIRSLLRSGRQDANRAGFPPTLQKVFFHGGTTERNCLLSGLPYEQTYSARRALEELCLSEPKLVFFDPRPCPPLGLPEPLCPGGERSRLEWLDRVNGGLGVWDESQRRVDPRFAKKVQG